MVWKPSDDMWDTLNTYVRAQDIRFSDYYSNWNDDPDRYRQRPNDPMRQTGRTSDMLWEAAKAKDEGAQVLVIVHEERMIKHCLYALNGGWWGLEPNDFMTLERFQDLLRGRRGYMLFVDHVVEEWAMHSAKANQWYHILREWNQWQMGLGPTTPPARFSGVFI